MWLQTPVYNSHKNDGLGSIRLLHTQFDVQDESDYATQMKRLITSSVDAQTNLTKQALRMQYDHMRTAHTAIICMGQDAQPDSALQVFFDNTLPQAYSTVRQLVRQKNHPTSAEHFREYFTQVRAQLSSRQVSAVAYAAAATVATSTSMSAAAPPSTSTSRKPAPCAQPKANGLSDSVCLRCLWSGYQRGDREKPAMQCS